VQQNGNSFPDLFTGFCARIVRRLPFGLAAVVAPSFLGFALINGFTFAVDLALLTFGRGVLGFPLPVSITLAYLGAFGLSFVLNRSMNFTSHAPVGGQLVRYLLVIGVNYLVFILGVGAGLAGLGVEYHLSRVLAGAGEAVFMYCMMRWVVFGDARSNTEEGTPPTATTRGQPR
jgi:putative flippase GtrA